MSCTSFICFSNGLRKVHFISTLGRILSNCLSLINSLSLSVALHFNAIAHWLCSVSSNPRLNLSPVHATWLSESSDRCAVHTTQIVVSYQEFSNRSVTWLQQGHTLQDLWPGGLPDELVWCPNHVRRVSWYLEKVWMLLPQPHLVFLHGLGPGSAWDFRAHVEKTTAP